MRVAHSRLQTVIKVKQFQVKKAQRELAVLSVHRQGEQHRLQTLEERQSAAMSDASRAKRGRAADLQTNQAYIQSISQQIVRQEEKVVSLQGQEEGKRVELVEKSQSKQMLEKLDSRRKAAEEKKEEQKNQAIIDGLAQRPQSAT